MAVRAGFLLCRRRKAVAAPSLSAKRFLSCVSPTVSSKEEKMALDMIRYAKSLKQDEPSYSEAVRVLEQGLSFFTGGGLPSSMASGRLQLCLATIHANRYNYEAAAESLQYLINTGSMPLEIKGSAMEALACLCLQLHQDNEALVQADQLMSLLADEDVHAVQLQSMKFNSLALKKLVELALGSSDIELEGLSSLVDLENASGGAVLDIAELSHVHGSLSAAKVMYEKAISLSKKELEENGKFLSAIATTPEAVHTGAIAGLGQLLTSMGDFEGAEFQLTEALKLSEKTKGEKHPQVGAILSCIGNLYHQRAKAEGRSELLITEGVYKSALDLLKAQALDRESDRGEQYTDIVALTRARLGVALAPSLKRRSEVEKLKSSVETRWGNSRPLPDFLYLKHLLDSDNIDNKQETTAQGNTLVDIRLGRVFYK